MARFGLAHLLLLLAALTVAVGLIRLRVASADSRRRLRQALIVWCVLITSSALVWLMAMLQ